MHPDESYGLTPLGEAELRGSGTRLSTAQINVLVRLDGHLTLGQLMSGMGPDERASFAAIFRDLRDKHFVKRVEADPFTLQWDADVAQLARNVGQAEVDLGLSSLQRAGFYVQIAKGRQTPRLPAAGGKLSAIVVEDDATLASFVAALLALSNFEVRQAGTREQVVAEIRRPPRPDLMLLDVVLPDADGFDILRRVRAHPALADVPVIMLTGKATREAVLQGMTSGADGYITKPFEPHALLRAIQTVLGLPVEADAGPWKTP